MDLLFVLFVQSAKMALSHLSCSYYMSTTSTVEIIGQGHYNGILLVQGREANLTRVRDHEHDAERTRSWIVKEFGAAA